MSDMTKDGIVELGSVEDERFDVGAAVSGHKGYQCIKHGSNVETVFVNCSDGQEAVWCQHCWMEQNRNDLIPEQERE